MSNHGNVNGKAGIFGMRRRLIPPLRWINAAAQIRLGHSALTRKIVAFNLTAILLLVVGILSVNPFRDSLVMQQENALIREADLLVQLIEIRLAIPTSVPSGLLHNVPVPEGSAVHLFDEAGTLVAEINPPMRIANLPPFGPTWMSDLLATLSGATAGLWRAEPLPPMYDRQDAERSLVNDARTHGAATMNTQDPQGQRIFGIAKRIGPESQGHILSITSFTGEIDTMMRVQREQVLQIFVIAIIVSIGLSLVLASAISNPLAELARAAESGQYRRGQKRAMARIRIPDFGARPDEIGRLSSAIRSMVDALYDRIDYNEQFAADVAHEIKNPLASLRSAAMSLARVSRENQRQQLITIINKDVSRLDRLVSDISNASRLDRELVREEEHSFDLVRLLTQLCAHYQVEAEARGIQLIDELPDTPVIITGLEARLAQVFVNLITNALSFSEKGDVIRVWARRRGNRLLAVVEDTGPGIPDEALSKIFQRFYSQRPENSFGEHSGLGLAISKQIVEAHGGVIWAENIRSSDADMITKPLGARFVVGLPL